MAIDRLPHLDDDGLFLPEVGDWGETKYRLIANYSAMFATAMKAKWDARVYVDLFAGAGRARIKGTSLIIPTSATLALGVRHPFDKYVLCDNDPTALDALEKRARRDASERDIAFVLGDCNRNVDRIMREIPKPRSGFRVLSFCVVDPYKTGALKFETIRALSTLFVDFLVLIPSFMDAHRNLHNYLATRNRVIGDFLGNPEGRPSWDAVASEGPRKFGIFLVDQFGRSMRSLRYLYDGPGEEVPVRNTKKGVIYHLAFFSRSELGRKFWREARKSSVDQLGLPFGTA